MSSQAKWLMSVTAFGVAWSTSCPVLLLQVSLRVPIPTTGNIEGLSAAAFFPCGAFNPEVVSSLGIVCRTGLKFPQTILMLPLHTLGPNNPITKKGNEKVGLTLPAPVS